MTTNNSAVNAATATDGPAELLRLAAQLVERALAKIDGSYRTCAGCGAKRFNDVPAGRAVERLAETAPRLRNVADSLDAAKAQAVDDALVARARAAAGRL